MWLQVSNLCANKPRLVCILSKLSYQKKEWTHIWNISRPDSLYLMPLQQALSSGLQLTKHARARMQEPEMTRTRDPWSVSKLGRHTALTKHTAAAAACVQDCSRFGKRPRLLLIRVRACARLVLMPSATATFVSASELAMSSEGISFLVVGKRSVDNWRSKWFEVDKSLLRLKEWFDLWVSGQSSSGLVLFHCVMLVNRVFRHHFYFLVFLLSSLTSEGIQPPDDNWLRFCSSPQKTFFCACKFRFKVCHVTQSITSLTDSDRSWSLSMTSTSTMCEENQNTLPEPYLLITDSDSEEEWGECIEPSIRRLSTDNKEGSFKSSRSGRDTQSDSLRSDSSLLKAFDEYQTIFALVVRWNGSSLETLDYVLQRTERYSRRFPDYSSECPIPIFLLTQGWSPAASLMIGHWWRKIPKETKTDGTLYMQLFRDEMFPSLLGLSQVRDLRMCEDINVEMKAVLEEMNFLSAFQRKSEPVKVGTSFQANKNTNVSESGPESFRLSNALGCIRAVARRIKEDNLCTNCFQKNHSLVNCPLFTATPLDLRTARWVDPDYETLTNGKRPLWQKKFAQYAFRR